MSFPQFHSARLSPSSSSSSSSHSAALPQRDRLLPQASHAAHSATAAILRSPQSSTQNMRWDSCKSSEHAKPMMASAVSSSQIRSFLHAPNAAPSTIREFLQKAAANPQKKKHQDAYKSLENPKGEEPGKMQFRYATFNERIKANRAEAIHQHRLKTKNGKELVAKRDIVADVGAKVNSCLTGSNQTNSLISMIINKALTTATQSTSTALIKASSKQDEIATLNAHVIEYVTEACQKLAGEMTRAANGKDIQHLLDHLSATQTDILAELNTNGILPSVEQLDQLKNFFDETLITFRKRALKEIGGDFMTLSGDYNPEGVQYVLEEVRKKRLVLQKMGSDSGVEHARALLMQKLNQIAEEAVTVFTDDRMTPWEFQTYKRTFEVSLKTFMQKANFQLTFAVGSDAIITAATGNSTLATSSSSSSSTSYNNEGDDSCSGMNDTYSSVITATTASSSSSSCLWSSPTTANNTEAMTATPFHSTSSSSSSSTASRPQPATGNNTTAASIYPIWVPQK